MLSRAVSLSLGVVMLSGCGSPAHFFDYKDPRQSAEIRHPRKTVDPGFFKEEHQYLATRRHAVGLSPFGVGADAIPDNAVGLAFSGGGLRSAYYNLGVLEGLQEVGLLKHMDYISASSGGAYVSAWLVSRWDSPSGKLAKDYGQHNFFFKDASEVLDKDVEYKTDVQAKGFVVGVGKKEAIKDGSKHLASYVGKFVPNLVFDVAVHFKPAPGKFNSYHLIYNYREGLERGFLPPLKEPLNREHKRIGMQDVNPPGSKAPYLIVNAALANDEPWALGNFSKWIGNLLNPKKWTELHHFEFSRNQCGGPDIGFVPTEVFDHGVARTRDWREESLLGRKVPHKVQWRRSAFPGIRTTKPFPVSNAVAASGAAVDSAGTKYRLLVDRLLKPLNLNLRYQTSNFAQSWSHALESPLDRTREVLWDRFRPTYRSNSIYLSDAGHFDNLAITALVSRGVRTIYMFDAGQDGGYEFADVKKTKGRIESLKCPHCDGNLTWNLCPAILKKLVKERTDNPKLLGMETFIVRSQISAPCGKVLTEVNYVKSSYHAEFAKEDSRLQKLVQTFAASDKYFPHEPTFHVSPYSKEKFDAYRSLGSFAARCLKARTHTIDASELSD